MMIMTTTTIKTMLLMKALRRNSLAVMKQDHEGLSHIDVLKQDDMSQSFKSR